MRTTNWPAGLTVGRGRGLLSRRIFGAVSSSGTALARSTLSVIRVGYPPVLAGTIEVQWDQPYLRRPRQVNVAYGLYPAWRGKGVASRAADLACDHALTNGATAVIIRADPRNQASLAVARRCAFTYLRTSGADGAPLQWWVRALDPPRPVPAWLHPAGLILLIGPPGAGKSTFACSLVQTGLVDRNAIVSADQIAGIMLAGHHSSETHDRHVFAEVDGASRTASAAGCRCWSTPPTCDPRPGCD